MIYNLDITHIQIRSYVPTHTRTNTTHTYTQTCSQIHIAVVMNSKFPPMLDHEQTAHTQTLTLTQTHVLKIDLGD